MYSKIEDKFGIGDNDQRQRQQHLMIITRTTKSNWRQFEAELFSFIEYIDIPHQNRYAFYANL